MDRTLLLNATFEPLGIVTWRKAVTLVFLQKVEVLSEYEKEIKSVSSSVKLPAVIRLLRFVRNHRNGVKFTRRNVFLRDEQTCQYCGKKFDTKFLTCDHIIPRSRGGTTEWTNIVTSCIYCNLKKSDKLPEESEMYPRKRPSKPDNFYILRLNMGVKVLPEHWRSYTFGGE
jgi:5-methylcytosine-specific restriction endonuclease McrA